MIVPQMIAVPVGAGAGPSDAPTDVVGTGAFDAVFSGLKGAPSVGANRAAVAVPEPAPAGAAPDTAGVAQDASLADAPDDPDQLPDGLDPVGIPNLAPDPPTVSRDIPADLAPIRIPDAVMAISVASALVLPVARGPADPTVATGPSRPVPLADAAPLGHDVPDLRHPAWTAAEPSESASPEAMRGPAVAARGDLAAQPAPEQSDIGKDASLALGPGPAVTPDRPGPVLTDGTPIASPDAPRASAGAPVPVQAAPLDRVAWAPAIPPAARVQAREEQGRAASDGPLPAPRDRAVGAPVPPHHVGQTILTPEAQVLPAASAADASAVPGVEPLPRAKAGPIPAAVPAPEGQGGHNPADPIAPLPHMAPDAAPELPAQPPVPVAQGGSGPWAPLVQVIRAERALGLPVAAAAPGQDQTEPPHGQTRPQEGQPRPFGPVSAVVTVTQGAAPAAPAVAPAEVAVRQPAAPMPVGIALAPGADLSAAPTTEAPISDAPADPVADAPADPAVEPAEPPAARPEPAPAADPVAELATRASGPVDDRALLADLPRVIPDQGAQRSVPPTVPPAALAAQIVPAVSDAGRTEIDLALAPEELGRLRLTLRPDGDTMQITVQAERPETLDLMRRNADQLAAEMRALGYRGADLTFTAWGDGRRPDPGHAPARDRPGATGTALHDPAPVPCPLAASGQLYLRL